MLFGLGVNMVEEIEYHENKLPGRVYISGAFDTATENGNKGRFISKVFDLSERGAFIKVKDEILLRVTPGGRQEVKALFYETNRAIQSLAFVKFERKTGTPHIHQFVFHGDEIEKVYNVLRAVKVVNLPDSRKTRFEDATLDEATLDDESLLNFLSANPDLVKQLLEHGITNYEVKALGYRKAQLAEFRKMLDRAEHFERRKEEWGANGDEAAWQNFFERNSWIFGYGLNYIFTSPLDEERLEQVVAGSSFYQSGKRVDALLKTRGLISSLCIVEIKTHRTNLLKSNPYRPESWAISSEMAGGISQSQRAVQKAVSAIPAKISLTTARGDPKGDDVYSYSPKAYLVIGSLAEFITENGVNEQKFSSFEMFRKNINNPEIITFDELYERAQFIVRHSMSDAPLSAPELSEDRVEYGDIPDIEDEIPF